MNEELNEFISTFIQREKQDRYRSLLSSKKRRNDGVLDLLHNGRHLDKNKFTRIPDYEAVSIAEQLRKLGVKGQGYVLAVHGELNDHLLSCRPFLKHI